jgi:general secretion pathway protein G
MTLVEILAVVVILGLLAVTLTVGISGKMGRARSEIAKAQIAQIVTQVQTFQLEKRVLPKAGEGLAALTGDPKAAYYLEPNKLNDPWGRAYQYLIPGPKGQPFEVVTYGADGQPGGTGEDGDVSSVGEGQR